MRKFFSVCMAVFVLVASSVYAQETVVKKNSFATKSACEQAALMKNALGCKAVCSGPLTDPNGIHVLVVTDCKAPEKEQPYIPTYEPEEEDEDDDEWTTGDYLLAGGIALGVGFLGWQIGCLAVDPCTCPLHFK